MTIKVLIVDDNQLFGEILAKRFAETSDIEVVAQADTSLEVLQKTKLSRPDIILMDIGMAHLNCIDITMALSKNFPDIKIIALTAHNNKINIKGMLEANAWGYLLKNCTYDQLVDAITQVHDGKKYLSSDVKEFLIEDYLEQESKGKMKLTDRESEILKSLAEGKSIREISEMFLISIKTVGTHKQNIFEKMNFENMAQLIKFAIKNGIISL
ncbi:MAG: response regulator transcription factor [Bacteroidales bacterium]|nr:response regulator transcription factor [Bacteroidales bacterium]